MGWVVGRDLVGRFVCAIYAAHVRAGGYPARVGAAVIAHASNSSTVEDRRRCMPHHLTLVFIGRESGGTKGGGSSGRDSGRI